MSLLQIADLAADRIEGEVVAAFFFQDRRPLLGPAALLDWRLNGCVTDLLVRGKALGAAGEHVVAANNGKLNADWAWFAGGGTLDGLDGITYRQLIGHLLTSCRQAGFSRIALCLETLDEMSPQELKNLAAGALDATGYDDLECQLCLGF